MAINDAELQRVADELAIRSLVERYSDAVMRHDARSSSKSPSISATRFATTPTESRSGCMISIGSIGPR